MNVHVGVRVGVGVPVCVRVAVGDPKVGVNVGVEVVVRVGVLVGVDVRVGVGEVGISSWYSQSLTTPTSGSTPPNCEVLQGAEPVNVMYGRYVPCAP